jgi:hypothetical protein
LHHLPDAELTVGGTTVVEVELTPKHLKRLIDIVAWHTHDYGQTRYYVAPPPSAESTERSRSSRRNSSNESRSSRSTVPDAAAATDERRGEPAGIGPVG